MRRPGPPREMPPPLELECLKALWDLGEASVRQVREELEPERRLAYTTVMTLLDRLARKGAVSRRKVGRSFRYTPVLARETLQRLAVAELVGRFFGGSREALMDYLSGAAPALGRIPETGADGDAALDTALL